MSAADWVTTVTCPPSERALQNRDRSLGPHVNCNTELVSSSVHCNPGPLGRGVKFRERQH